MVSVITPIYNVEAFIERCARSLMEQTLEDVEFIFVDDCSPDRSTDILQRVVAEYPQRNVQILHHEVNRGLPASRNTGLANATGEYIFHCDSDDYMERDALEKMYEAAKQEDADIVYSDWYLTFPKKERYMSCPAYSTSEEALRGLLHGAMKYNVWNKLVRRNLYTEKYITFPEGHGMGEDMTMILLFARASKVTYLPQGTYHYVRQNENAFTAPRQGAMGELYEDLRFNAERVIAALTGSVTDEDLACFKLNVKYPFLISNRREDYERWNRWFPEANSYITSHQVSTRARFLEACASKKFWMILRIHSYMLQVVQR